jgi:hypothetical protein
LRKRVDVSPAVVQVHEALHFAGQTEYLSDLKASDDLGSMTR